MCPWAGYVHTVVPWQFGIHVVAPCWVFWEYAHVRGTDVCHLYSCAPLQFVALCGNMDMFWGNVYRCKRGFLEVQMFAEKHNLIRGPQMQVPEPFASVTREDVKKSS